jgi:hypothetical protein
LETTRKKKKGKKMFQIGDKVCLRIDPLKDEGVVADIYHNRYFVTWNNGRTWVYAASWLEKIS